MAQTDVDHDVLLDRLLTLANQSLSLWDLPGDASARLINISENATYMVENPAGYRAILRVHREDYHTERAIECELLWMDALNAENCVVTPDVIAGKDGKAVQRAELPGELNERFLVMFEFVEGDQPDESHDLVAPFEELGEMAAKPPEMQILPIVPRA